MKQKIIQYETILRSLYHKHRSIKSKIEEKYEEEVENNYLSQDISETDRANIKHLLTLQYLKDLKKNSLEFGHSKRLLDLEFEIGQVTNTVSSSVSRKPSWTLLKIEKLTLKVNFKIRIALLLITAILGIYLSEGFLSVFNSKALIDGLNESLRKGIDSTGYSVTQVPDTMRIFEKIGNYYRVDIKLNEESSIDLNAADNSKIILFDEGKYIQNKQSTYLIENINEFLNHIYKALDEQYPIRLYVKGTADKVPLTGDSVKLVSPYDFVSGFSTMEILPYVASQDIYYDNPVPFEVTDYFTNDDLPNLRARFIQNLFTAFGDDIPLPTILEGNVENIEDERWRNAHLLLFVAKDDEKKDYQTALLITGTKAVFVILLFLFILLFGLSTKEKYIEKSYTIDIDLD